MRAQDMNEIVAKSTMDPEKAQKLLGEVHVAVGQLRSTTGLTNLQRFRLARKVMALIGGSIQLATLSGVAHGGNSKTAKTNRIKAAAEAREKARLEAAVQAEIAEASRRAYRRRLCETIVESTGISLEQAEQVLLAIDHNCYAEPGLPVHNMMIIGPTGTMPCVGEGSPYGVSGGNTNNGRAWR